MKSGQNWLAVSSAYLESWKEFGVVRVSDDAGFYLKLVVPYNEIVVFEEGAKRIREKLGLAIELLETKEDGSQVYKVYDPDST